MTLCRLQETMGDGKRFYYSQGCWQMLVLWTTVRPYNSQRWYESFIVGVQLVHPHLLHDVLPANSPITVNGIGGKQLKAKHTGYLDDFFREYSSEQAKPLIY